MINNYINKERLGSSLLLYFFFTILYGFTGFQISTYIVFGITYLYHVNTVIGKLMLGTGNISSRINTIDTIYFLIIVLSITILLLVATHWQLVVYFSFVGVFFIFIMYIIVILMNKN